MDFEIRTPEGELLETLKWDGDPWTWKSGEAEARRWALRDRAITRAYELGALAYERRNEDWLESAHRDFACREVSDDEVEVTTPVGVFRLRARRARPGETVTSVAGGIGLTGSGRTAAAEQTSPPVRISGRLNVPGHSGPGWTFQPDHFTYADGTRSDFLGCPVIAIELRSRVAEAQPKGHSVC